MASDSSGFTRFTTATNVEDTDGMSRHLGLPSSSWWRTPNRALPYWRLFAKYPYLLLPFLHAVWTPKFRVWTSSSIVLSQVAHGRPTGLLQSVGGLRAAAMTRWWSSSGAEWARCPKNLRRKDFTLSETGKRPVILRTVSLVVCLVYGIRRIFHKHRLMMPYNATISTDIHNLWSFQFQFYWYILFKTVSTTWVNTTIW